MDAINVWLVGLSESGVLPDGALFWITKAIDTVTIALGLGPCVWG